MRAIKPGDICMIITGYNYGRMVQAIEPHLETPPIDLGPEPWKAMTLQTTRVNLGFGPFGMVRGDVPPGTAVLYKKSALRPIGDDEGEDETFSWAGKPSEMTKLLTDPLWKTLERL